MPCGKGRHFEVPALPAPLHNPRDRSSASQRRQVMLIKFISGIAGAALMLAVGMAGTAHAIPGCYKTGPNTVQCTR